MQGGTDTCSGRFCARGRPVQEVQLYVELHASEWAFLQSAHSSGRQLAFTGIDREVESGGRIKETVGVTIPYGLLYRHRNDGFVVRIYGQRGNLDVFVSPAYIQGYLSKAG